MPKIPVKVCSIEGCGRTGQIRRTWCVLHYSRWQAHGDPLTTVRPTVRPRYGMSGPCVIDGCSRPIHNKTNGWCERHYHRWYRYGDPLATKLDRRPCGIDGCAEPACDFGLCRAHGKEHAVAPGFRRCSECLTTFPRTNFYPNSGFADGMDGRCKPCRNRLQKGQRTADPEKAKATWRRNRAKNLEKSKAAVRRWQQNHPAYVRDAAAFRRALIKQVPTEAIRSAVVMERDQWTCQICTEPIDPDLPSLHPLSPSLDHVVPLSRGGSHTYDNVQASHLRCNMRKGARMN